MDATVGPTERGGVRHNEAAEKAKCAACGGTMEEGFLLDRTVLGATSAGWVAGPPEPSSWKAVKLTGRKVRKVSAFRCAKCGRLELYAL